MNDVINTASESFESEVDMIFAFMGACPFENAPFADVALIDVQDDIRNYYFIDS